FRPLLAPSSCRRHGHPITIAMLWYRGPAIPRRGVIAWRISGSPAGIICSTATTAADSLLRMSSSRLISRGRSLRRRRMRAPPRTARGAERRLPADLLNDPRRPIASSEIAAIADADARENWTLMIAFRDHLVGHKTVEAAYLDLVRRGVGQTPLLFINQLVHVILRNLLDRCDDVFMLRAAELFFRQQRLTVHDGSLIAADEEKVTGVSPQPTSSLVAMLGLPVAGEIDVLNDGNAESYWERSDLFDMALDLTAGRRGLDALGKVIERWIAHLLSVEVEIEALIEATEVNLTWYVGLDAEATGIGDALWTGGELHPAA